MKLCVGILSLQHPWYRDAATDTDTSHQIHKTYWKLKLPSDQTEFYRISLKVILIFNSARDNEMIGVTHRVRESD